MQILPKILQKALKTVQHTVVLHGLAPWLSKELMPIKVYRQ